MRRTALIATALWISCGCQTGQKLVGVWKGALSRSSVEIQFRADGTYTTHLAKERNGGLKHDGTYKVDGNSVTLSPKTVSTPAGSMDASSAALGRDMRYSITWKGDNSMTMGNMRDSMELTRAE